MSDPSHATAVGEEYMFTRTSRESARLYLQHWLRKEMYGYLLHPSVQLPNDQHQRIADVGTGNACWLLDLAGEVPQSWSLEGFDVSDSLFPHQSCLPSNVSLQISDAFGPVPANLVGAFDVVHIRAFSIVIKNGDPSPLLRNLMTMLKPGGILQWDESDPQTFSAYPPPASDLGAASSDAIQTWFTIASKLSLQMDWMSPGRLEALLEQHGLIILNDTAADRLESPTTVKPLVRKVYTDHLMGTLEETCKLIISRGGDAGSVISADEFREKLQGTMIEVQQGVSLWLDVQVVVGRKPA